MPGSRTLGAFTFANDCAFIRRTRRVPIPARICSGIPMAASSRSRRPGAARHARKPHPDRAVVLSSSRTGRTAGISGGRSPARRSSATHEARGEPPQAARVFIEYWIGPAAWDAMPERRKELMTLGLPKLKEDWPGTLDDHTRLADYRSLSLPTLLMRAKDTRAPSFRIAELLRTGAAEPDIRRNRERRSHVAAHQSRAGECRGRYIFEKANGSGELEAYSNRQAALSPARHGLSYLFDNWLWRPPFPTPCRQADNSCASGRYRPPHFQNRCPHRTANTAVTGTCQGVRANMDRNPIANVVSVSAM